jgi:hypothetical protein
MSEKEHQEKDLYERPELKKEGELKDITAGNGTIT